MKKWIIKQPDKAAAEKLAREAGISVFAAKLLVNRGIFTRDEAEEFFNAEELTPPEELTDMEKAAEVISRAIENNDKITVYGDYDCDGITATVILYGYLEAIGANADWYIPGRDEGYGLNKNAIDKLAADGTKLIITVDNGISAIDEAEYIKEIKGEYPVMLLDDIMSELDINRRMYLAERIRDKQVLITSTDTDLIDKSTDTKLFHIENGTVI